MNMLRYVKLWLSLAKFSLLGEMAFRGNFLVKIVVELLVARHLAALQRRHLSADAP